MTRPLHLIALLLCLLAPSAFADRLYQVELLVFRQGGEPVIAPKIAPDDWAGNALPIGGSERSTALNGEAAKLNPGNGYQLLLHKAWSQTLGNTPSSVSITSGDGQLGHYPVEGTLNFVQERFTDLNLDLWINHFSADGLVEASEHMKVSQRLKDNSLAYLDHGSLGALIRISPL
ncbi:CsiV family protein [Pseudomonas sp. NCHU5208]|uniref:CsiV family protein n=1 Tax=unclassified Pseudomonas TaxID=196821 RepID=UPI003F9DFA97